MNDYIRDAYEEIRDRYKLYYSSPNSQQKPSRLSAFFKAIFSYIFRRPEPIILSGEQRNRFEKGLDSKLISNYNIEYGPGSIVFKPKGLVKRI